MLLQSVLSAISIFYLSVVKIAMTASKQREGLMRSFFWKASGAGGKQGDGTGHVDMGCKASQVRRAGGVAYKKYESGTSDKMGEQNYESRRISSYNSIESKLWYMSGFRQVHGTSLGGWEDQHSSKH